MQQQQQQEQGRAVINHHTFGYFFFLHSSFIPVIGQGSSLVRESKPTLPLVYINQWLGRPLILDASKQDRGKMISTHDETHDDASREMARRLSLARL